MSSPDPRAHDRSDKEYIDPIGKKRAMAKKMVGKKGKGSLNMPKGEKNEGERMYLGKNENNRE